MPSITRKYRSIPEMLDKQSEKYGTSRPIFREKRGGTWVEETWNDFRIKVGRLAMGLMKLGFEPKDAGAVYAYNCPDWLYMDFAFQFAGGCTAAVYMNDTADEAAYKIEHSESKFVFVDDENRLRNVLDKIEKLPNLSKIVVPDTLKSDDDRIITVTELQNLSPEAAGRSADLDARMAGIDPEDPFTIIYTSGTTATPKGAILTHANFTWVLECAATLDIPRQDHDFTISYLPLAHVAQRIGDYLGLYTGSTISFAQSLETFPDDMKEIRPTAFVAVPRVLEKVYLKIMGGAEAKGGVALKLFKWAEGLAREQYRHKVYGEPRRPLFEAQYALANKLIYTKIKDALGGRVNYIAAGGAALPAHIGEFFYGLGLPILEVYGLTETSAPISHCTLTTARYGTVGQVLPDCEVRIDDDGEVLFKGPNLFPGYYKQPDATAEAIDEDGWFHTGDLGSLDTEGYLKITGRKKELIVTSGGKNVAPVPVESEIKRLPFISQAVVIGDDRNYLTALLTLNEEDLGEYANKENIPFASVKDLADSEQIRKIIGEHVERVNAELPTYMRVKKWTILPEDFSIEDGELTPSMKLKRRIITEKYGKVIDDLYA